ARRMINLPYRKGIAMAHRMLSVLSTVVLVALAGCSTSHHGASNRMGTIYASIAAPPARVAAAAEEVLQEMNIPIVSAASTDIDGKVVGESARDRRITINIDLKGDNASDVRIRHGAFGDENISITVLR